METRIDPDGREVHVQFAAAAHYRGHGYCLFDCNISNWWRYSLNGGAPVSAPYNGFEAAAAGAKAAINKLLTPEELASFEALRGALRKKEAKA